MIAPALDDEEGATAPLPSVFDGHVHLFPDRVFDAIWRWFDRYGWPIRYKLYCRDVIAFLRSRGVTQMVALCYAHKPGMARALNRYMAEMCAEHPSVSGFGTVMPGEPDAPDILREAFALGLRGIKIHCHVQCVAPDAAEMDDVYRACSDAGRPLLMHAGREPKSPHYNCDTDALCTADRVADVLARFSALRLCIPHLGADEFLAYATLMEKHQNLWLDTTMMLAGYFPEHPSPWPLLARFSDRIIYGSDFPNLPYAWDRELKNLALSGLEKTVIAKIAGENARRFFGDGIQS